MGLGILDDRYLKHVPGTSLFRDDPSAAVLALITRDEETGKELNIDLGKLKHAKGKHSHIVLVPQPSDDPNDPLNWPSWKKHLVCCGLSLVRIPGPLLDLFVDLPANLNRPSSFCTFFIFS